MPGPGAGMTMHYMWVYPGGHTAYTTTAIAPGSQHRQGQQPLLYLCYTFMHNIYITIMYATN